MTSTALHNSLKRELHANWKETFGSWKWLLHIAIWTIMLLFIQFIEQDTFGNIFSLQFLLIVLTAAGFNYTIILWITPFNRYRSNSWILTGSVVLNLFLWWAALFFIRVRLYYAYPETMPVLFQKEKGMILGVSLGNLLIMIWIFFACYYFIDLYNQQAKLNKYQKVLSDKLNAELTFLKTQINPHFLFNTLNSIYSLTLKKDIQAASVAFRLKDLLHYMLYDCSQNTVLLTDEIKFLKNYISLEEQRNKKENVNISFSIKGDAGNRPIAPLLLINFIENAFKHGVKGGIGHAVIDINMAIENDHLSFSITNSKPEVQETTGMAVKSGGGIGLANVKQRLHILYPKKHKLIIRDTDTAYSVRLDIALS